MTTASIARLLWLLTCAVVLGGGVGLVWLPSAQQVAELRGEASHYYDEATQNEEAVRGASELETVRARVQDDVRSLTPSSTPGQATAILVALLARESLRYHIAIRSIVPDGSVPSPSGPFDTTKLELTLSGTFADVVHFIADAPRRDALFEIRDVTLGCDDRRHVDPVLSVTIHTTLYRMRGSRDAGGYHVASTL